MELLPLFASNVFKLTIEEDTDSLLNEESFSNSVEQGRQEGGGNRLDVSRVPLSHSQCGLHSSLGSRNSSGLSTPL